MCALSTRREAYLAHVVAAHLLRPAGERLEDSCGTAAPRRSMGAQDGRPNDHTTTLPMTPTTAWYPAECHRRAFRHARRRWAIRMRTDSPSHERRQLRAPVRVDEPLPPQSAKPFRRLSAHGGAPSCETRCAQCARQSLGNAHLRALELAHLCRRTARHGTHARTFFTKPSPDGSLARSHAAVWHPPPRSDGILPRSLRTGAACTNATVGCSLARQSSPMSL